MAMLWDTREWICTTPLASAEGTVRQVAFSFCGQYLCIACEDGEEIEIISVQSGDVVAVIPLSGNNAGIPQNVVTGGSTGGAGSLRNGSSDDSTTTTTSTEDPTNKTLTKPPAPAPVRVSNVGGVSSANCIAWHPQRYWLAYAGEPGGLRIVGAAGGEL